MKMKTANLFALAIVAALWGSSGARADVNIITNGGFEDPQIGQWYVNYASGLPAWNVFTNNVDIVAQGFNGPSPAYEGNQYLDLVGFGSTGGIQQVFTTQIGQTYVVTFAYANNPWGGSANYAAEVDVFGASQLLTDSVTHSNATTSNLNWLTYSNTFVANSEQTRLSFNTTFGANSGGILLDAVAVSAVPELSTWAMMLFGFAGIGLVAYRRAKKASIAVAA